MIKKKGLVLLTAACLSLSFAGAVVSVSHFDNVSQNSYAETTAFDTSQAVSVTGATVTAGADKSGGETHKGLLIAPETSLGSYSGTLNAVLPADSTIRYTFPGSLNGDGSSKWIDFTFRFTSVKTGEWFEVYTVMINGNWWNSLMVRDMEGHTRTTNRWGGNNWWDVKLDNGNMYPQYGGSDLPSGYLKTVYADGVFSLDVPSSDTNVTLAKFDCDEYTAIPSDKTSINGSLCGLKKIDFSEGYTLSFAANACNGYATAPLLIESINDQSFESASFEAEPSWYTTYATMPKITLEGEIAEGYLATEPLTVPGATYVTLESPTAQPVAKIELSKDGGEWKSVSVGDIIYEAGSYVIRYTAVEGGTVGNVVEKSFKVSGEAFDITSVITSEGATVTAGADQSGGVTHKGLLIAPETSLGSYSGTLNAVLPADSTIRYTFPGSLNGDGSSKWIDFTFRFTSVKTGEWFEVYTVMINGNWWNSLMVRDMEGHNRTTNRWGAGWFEEANANCFMFPQYGGSEYSAGGFRTSYVDGVMSFECYTNNQSQDTFVTMAKFDSDAYQAVSGGVCGLKKIDFSEGYTVSFAANACNGVDTAPLLIESINDQSLERVLWAEEPSWYTTYATMPQITIDGEIAEYYTVEEPLTVPDATYVTPTNSTSLPVEKIELSKDGGEWYSISVGDSIDEAGSYVIRYTAVEGGTVGNVVEKSFKVVGEGFDIRDAVTVTGATVTAGADKSGGATHKGLLIAPETALGSYSGNLNAVLPANSTITYTFPGSLNSDWSSMWIDFTFRFTSVKTGEWFEVYTVMINGNWWNSLMVRDMEGHTRTTWIWGGPNWWDVPLDNGYMYPQYGGSDLPSGYLKTVYADGVFSLDVLAKDNTNVTLAKFDCDEYTAIPSGETSINGSLCGLKKIDFSEGYTLSFAANACNGYATAPLLIESINDQSLSGTTIYNWSCDSHEFVEEDLVIYSDGANVVGGSDLGVKFNYTATLGSLVFSGTKTLTPDLSALDLSTDNMAQVTYTFNGQTVVRDIKVVLQYTATVDGAVSASVTYTAENKAEKLAELSALLPANSAEYSYSWQTTLPAELPLENATYTIVKTANEYTATVEGAASGTITYTVENRAEKLAEISALLPESTAEYSYSWQTALPAELPLENVTYTIVKTAVEYTITFANADVKPIVFTTETIGSIEFPEVPKKLGYSNGAWDKAESDLTLADITVTATYTIGSVYGASVSTKGDIAMNFYISLSETTLADKDAYIEFTFEGQKSTVKLSEGVKNGEYYVYSYNVSAKNYDKQITLVLHATEGEGVTVTHSIKDYAATIASGEYSAEVKALVASLIDYCECAKNYFAGETSTEKFTEITAETLSGYAAVKEGTAPKGVTVLGASLVLETNTSIRVYFAGENAATAVVKVNGSAVVATKLEQGENVYYYVEISDISAKDLDTAYTVEIGEYKVTYSALSYAQASIESQNVALVNVLKAMCVYNQKADAYEQSKQG